MGYPQVNFGVPVPAPVNTVPFSGTGAVFRGSPAVFYLIIYIYIYIFFDNYTTKK